MQNSESHNCSSRTTSAFLFALSVTGILLFCWPQVAVWWKGVSVESAGEQAETQLVSARVDVGRIPSKQAPAAMTRAIEILQVGDRVLAHNPEVPQAERDGFVEPQWNEWLQLSLTMPKADGSLLKIELLRPEAWVREQLGMVVEPAAIAARPVTAESLLSAAAAYVDSVPYSPLLPILREVAETGAELQLSGEELQAIFVEMDLPELAITGPAIVQDIRGPPPIRAGAGRVVTATFHHSSGDVIDLVVGGDSNSTESIGTTSNHPFWSVDRQEYVQAGQLAIGERLQTYSGDTKRVVSKLARPGPQAVYNLEVFAEHVYYVGKDGVLVHNSGRYADIDPAAPFGRKLDGSPKAQPDPKVDINAPHNAKIREIIQQQTSLGMIHIGGGRSAGVGNLAEIELLTSGGMKSVRRMDASFLDPRTGRVVHFNVGQKNLRGDPVIREREALLDVIRKADGFRTDFVVKFREYKP